MSPFTKFLGCRVNLVRSHLCFSGIQAVEMCSTLAHLIETTSFRLCRSLNLGIEARNRSASPTYPSTSKNISLIFFLACKPKNNQSCIVLDNNLHKVLEGTMLLVGDPSGLKDTVRSKSTLWPSRVREIHTWRVV